MISASASATASRCRRPLDAATAAVPRPPPPGPRRRGRAVGDGGDGFVDGPPVGVATPKCVPSCVNVSPDLKSSAPARSRRPHPLRWRSGSPARQSGRRHVEAGGMGERELPCVAVELALGATHSRFVRHGPYSDRIRWLNPASRRTPLGAIFLARPNRRHRGTATVTVPASLSNGFGEVRVRSRRSCDRPGHATDLRVFSDIPRDRRRRGSGASQKVIAGVLTATVVAITGRPVVEETCSLEIGR